MYLKKLKIGNVELENNLILAPMAGVTDLPFRKICKEFGPGLVCTEMVSSKAIFHDDSKTKLLMNTKGEKKPISMQIFGSDEETMGYASKYVSELADIVDINMGCPAPKVVKNGDGSKLLLDLEKAKQIINAVVQNSKVPVTLKFRMGWDNEHIVATELAKIAEDAGISAITIHNIPEGMAVGVVYAGYLAGNMQISAMGALALAIGIAIQNFPEGAIISMPLKAEGMSKGKAFLYGVLSGVVEPIGAVLTIFASGFIIPVLPYFLSFAAGAMMYVVIEELIPEMSHGDHSNIGTVMFAVGFTLMMILDVALG